MDLCGFGTRCRSGRIERQDQMTDDRHKGSTPAKGSRQDRLKRALRENLRRRKEQSKAQARGQGSNAASERPSNLHEAALDDTGGERDT
jgi:hypothetical protein